MTSETRRARRALIRGLARQATSPHLAETNRLEAQQKHLGRTTMPSLVHLGDKTAKDPHPLAVWRRISAYYRTRLDRNA